MTPTAIHALASRVETEESTDDLRAAVLTAFGSEAEPGSAPDPLRSVDDAKAFQPEGWRVLVVQQALGRWRCVLHKPAWPLNQFEEGEAPAEPRARTAAALRALAWEKEHTA